MRFLEGHARRKVIFWSQSRAVQRLLYDRHRKRSGRTPPSLAPAPTPDDLAGDFGRPSVASVHFVVEPPHGGGVEAAGQEGEGLG